MGQQLTIMVIEDSPTQAYQVKQFLTQHGIHTLVANDGIAGLRMMDETMPDVIILDVMLPKIDGFQLCRRFKKHSRTASIPIIMFTTASGDDDERFAYHTGADEYVVKGPGALDDLLDAIQRLDIFKTAV